MNVRKLLLIGIMVWAILSLAWLSWAADFTLKWDASPGATGYRIYRSVDNGATWAMVQEVGNVTEYALTGQPDGLTLYRAGAFNSAGERIRYTAGVFNWATAPQPPAQPTGAGIE